MGLPIEFYLGFVDVGVEVLDSHREGFAFAEVVLLRVVVNEF